MIEGTLYTEKVKAYFYFLITEFGFNVTEEIMRGNAFFDIHYKNDECIISISYENINDYLSVIIDLQNSELPDFDDITKTIHLSQLNAKLLSKVDESQIILNNEYFLKFKAKDELERKLLKSAKELRLYLQN